MKSTNYLLLVFFILLIVFLCGGILGSTPISERSYERPATFWDGIWDGAFWLLVKPEYSAPEYLYGLWTGIAWFFFNITFPFIYLGKKKGRPLQVAAPLLFLLIIIIIGFLLLLRKLDFLLSTADFIKSIQIESVGVWLTSNYHFLLIPVALLSLGVGIWLMRYEFDDRGSVPFLVGVGFLLWSMKAVNPWISENYHFLLIPVALLSLGVGIWLYVENVENMGVVPILVGVGLLLWSMKAVNPWISENYHFLLIPVALLSLGFGIWVYAEEFEDIGIIPILAGAGLLLWNLWSIGFIQLVWKGVVWIFDGIVLFFKWVIQHVF